jgi:hypothetical protein
MIGVISKHGVVFDEGEECVEDIQRDAKHLFKSTMKRCILFEDPCKMHVPCLRNTLIRPLR